MKTGNIDEAAWMASNRAIAERVLERDRLYREDPSSATVRNDTEIREVAKIPDAKLPDWWGRIEEWNARHPVTDVAGATRAVLITTMFAVESTAYDGAACTTCHGMTVVVRSGQARCTTCGHVWVMKK